VLLVITRPICYHNQMKRVISIYDYSISTMVMSTDDDKIIEDNLVSSLLSLSP